MLIHVLSSNVYITVEKYYEIDEKALFSLLWCCSIKVNLIRLSDIRYCKQQVRM